MEKNKKMSKYLKIILSEMCTYVDTTFDSVDFNKEGWFHNYFWTTEAEEKFLSWLEDFLYNNAEARREVMMFPNKNKRGIKRFAEMFVFNYGWVVHDV